MIRYFYWYAGAPADRPGGPWWYKDFKNENDCYHFRNTMVFALKKDVIVYNCEKTEINMFGANPSAVRLQKLLQGENYNVEAYDYEKGCRIV